MDSISHKRSNCTPILLRRMIITNLNTDSRFAVSHHRCYKHTKCTAPSFVNDDLVHDDWPLFAHVQNPSYNRLSLLDSTSYLRYKDYIVGGISEWTKPEIERVAYFPREKAPKEQKRIGQGILLLLLLLILFLPSFLPSAPDRRRSTLTADAYEADVKTFVKYEGTARGRSIRRHPRRMKRRLAASRRERRGSHC